MLSRRRHRVALRDQRGFTLVETLVAMVTGIVVTFALFAILEVSMHQSARISDVAQATQFGRGAMTHVVDELHSACVASGFRPVQEKSSETKLIVEDGFSEKSEVPSVATTAAGVHKDETSLESGTLTDKTYLATGTEAKGNYTFAAASTPAAGVRIGEHVTQAEESKKLLPLFTYYEYAKEATKGTSEASTTLKAIELKGSTLSAAQAVTVAAVGINFNTAPSDNNATLGRPVNLNSQVTFAFSVPSSEATVKAGPCE